LAPQPIFPVASKRLTSYLPLNIWKRTALENRFKNEKNDVLYGRETRKIVGLFYFQGVWWPVILKTG
jgi:hypothetical protein